MPTSAKVTHSPFWWSVFVPARKCSHGLCSGDPSRGAGAILNRHPIAISHLLQSKHQNLLHDQQLEEAKGESRRRGGLKKTLLRFKKNITHANEYCQSDSLHVLVVCICSCTHCPHGACADDP